MAWDKLTLQDRVGTDKEEEPSGGESGDALGGRRGDAGFIGLLIALSPVPSVLHT